MVKITRRAAVAGIATASVVAPTIAAVYRTGAVDIDAQLRELADQFKRDAMAIDPTIKGMWLGHSFEVPGRESAVMSIFLERDSDPFIAKKNQTI